MMDASLFNLGKEKGGCGCSILAGHQLFIQMFSHSPSSTVWGKKITWKNSWVKIWTGKSLTYYHHGQNRLNLEKINFIYCQLKIAQISEKQIKTKETLYEPHLPLFPGPPSLPHSCILYLFPSWTAQGHKEWELHLVHNTLSLLFLPHAFFPDPEWGQSDMDSFHRLQFFRANPSASVWGPSYTTEQMSVLMWLSMGCRGTNWSYSWSVWNLWYLECLFSLLLPLPLCLKGCFSPSFLTYFFQQLIPTQPFAHSSQVGWGTELEHLKGKKLVGWDKYNLIGKA